MSEPILKKRKVLLPVDDYRYRHGNAVLEDENEQSRREQEETLVALIEHRAKEVEHNRKRLAYYQLQLEESEERLKDAQQKLARCRCRNVSTTANSRRNIEDNVPESRFPSHEQDGEGFNLILHQHRPEPLEKVTTVSKYSEGLEGVSTIISTSKKNSGNPLKEVKLEVGSPSPAQIHESFVKPIQSKPDIPPQEVGLDSGPAKLSGHSKNYSQSQPRVKPPLIIPGMKPNQPVKTNESRAAASVFSNHPVKTKDSRPGKSFPPNHPVKTNDSRPGESVPPNHPVKTYDSRPRESVLLNHPVKTNDSRPGESVPPNQPVKTNNSRPRASTFPNPQSNMSTSSDSSGMGKQEADSPHRKSPQQEADSTHRKSPQQEADSTHRKSPQQEAFERRAKGIKRKPAQIEGRELVPLIDTKPSPTMIRCHQISLTHSKHKRKLRTLELCPTNDQLFATSALDGFVNLWKIQGKGSSANLQSTTDFMSPEKRRWPEDIAWHPEGNSLFSVYTADEDDSQVSILNLNNSNERNRVVSLPDKPHTKGIINNIMFMPWENTCFVTGGSDHAVVLWSEKSGENSWKPNALHKSLHSSTVMGVAGLQHKKMVLSAGADKRVFGFDVAAGKADYKLHIESKCMSILPNPRDLNLFMVQTGAPGRQLKLCDIRMKHVILHDFGWKQESSESQSALISQAWSPDGLYITSGSADPVIHIFDIRYNAHDPSQSIKAHQKRVFKAVWHHALPLLISISSDLNIGLHDVS